ncbi:ATP-binding protein [Streptomyces sp. NPDC059008]|uniref:ATP-binding protein n=1 Tax=Streptomyces sp. NPDC059008 TaxID=3346693 RepID=UPI003693D2DE
MLAPPTPTTWHIALPRGATAVPIARAMVRCAMQDLQATADRTTAQLLAAELVANALKHTRGADPVELVVELGAGGCRVEVHDGDGRHLDGLGAPPPAPSAPPPPGDGSAAPACARGRGLLLVRSLSSASGCRPTPRGKAVWFTLPELRQRRRSR